MELTAGWRRFRQEFIFAKQWIQEVACWLKLSNIKEEKPMIKQVGAGRP
jgi:hypothetical protein